MPESLRIIRTHLGLTTDLLLRFGAPLSAIWMGSYLLNILLLHAAVEIGLLSRFAGLIAIAPIILLQLLVFAAMFLVLRDGLPLMRRRSQAAQAEPDVPADEPRDREFFAGALLAVLIPFYGYYAGWGFLSNTLRDYSRLFLSTQISELSFVEPNDFGPTALEVHSSWWIAIAVLLIWLLRRTAKNRHKKTGHRFWPLLIVACETAWALLGLYLIAGWKDQLVAWLAHQPSPIELIKSLIPAANAEVMSPGTRPIDWEPAFQPWEWLKSLFWYAALPVIWFNLGAIIYGHDLNLMSSSTERMAGRIVRRWSGLPKPITDFIGYFWLGTIKRWHAVVNGIILAASAGMALTVSVIVLWRLADYLGRWAWVGATYLIGPQDALAKQLIDLPLHMLFGYPGQPQNGLIVVVIQFCILAAGLELAGRAQQQAAATSATAP